jgi:hypothetical protein
MSRITIGVSLAAHVLLSMPAWCDPTDWSANKLMPGCRYIIKLGPGRSPVPLTEMQTVYDGGACMGFVAGIAMVDTSLCLPPELTTDQMLRVVVKYIDERPQSMHHPFAVLVQQALATAWPCK